MFELIGIGLGLLFLLRIRKINPFLKKMEIDLPEDPAIPTLRIYPKNVPPCHRGI